MIWLLALYVTAAPDPVLELERQVATRPEDVDLRMRFALMLSWKGDTEASRRHAEAVLEKAPSYWDAHILLARLDGWDGQYDSAKSRLAVVLATEPAHPAALELLLTVAIWSESFDDAKTLADQMIASERSPELLFHLATIEVGRMYHVAARRAAAETLRRDPNHEGAQQMEIDVPLVQADLFGEFEILPESQKGHAETLVVRAFPRNRLSFSLIEEFRQRYGTTNNRILLQGDWRLNREMTLSLLGGAGAPAKVVPAITGGVSFAMELMLGLDAALSYRLDVLPISARLHRVRIDAGYRVIDQLRIEGAYSLGFLDYRRDEVPQIHYVKLDGIWVNPIAEVRLGYAFGTEVDLLLDPRNPTFLDPERALLRLSSHVLGLSGFIRPNRWFRILAGFQVQLRSDNRQTYRLQAGASFYY